MLNFFIGKPLGQPRVTYLNYTKNIGNRKGLISVNALGFYDKFYVAFHAVALAAEGLVFLSPH